MQTLSDDDVCKSCGQSYGWHRLNNPRHPFNNGQAGATDFLGPRRDRDQARPAKRAQAPAQGPQIASMPSDPVLRIALISAGVITPAQLAAAEESLRIALAATIGGPGGEGEVQERTTTQVDVGQRSGSGQEVGSQSQDNQG